MKQEISCVNVSQYINQHIRDPKTRMLRVLVNKNARKSDWANWQLR